MSMFSGAGADGSLFGRQYQYTSSPPAQAQSYDAWRQASTPRFYYYDPYTNPSQPSVRAMNIDQGGGSAAPGGGPSTMPDLSSMGGMTAGVGGNPNGQGGGYTPTPDQLAGGGPQSGTTDPWANGPVTQQGQPIRQKSYNPFGSLLDMLGL